MLANLAHRSIRTVQRMPESRSPGVVAKSLVRNILHASSLFPIFCGLRRAPMAAKYQKANILCDEDQKFCSSAVLSSRFPKPFALNILHVSSLFPRFCGLFKHAIPAKLIETNILRTPDQKLYSPPTHGSVDSSPLRALSLAPTSPRTYDVAFRSFEVTSC